MSWRDDKRWSDRFLPEIKSILGIYLIAEPPIEEDAERNTDLMVLKLDAVRIGCRIRKYQYLRPYGHQFTIRAGRPSGAKTELTKIIEGWGNYFFYGFADEREERLAQWVLGDLNALRIYINRQLVLRKGEVPGLPKENLDNSSSFIVFEHEGIPNFIIAQSKNIG